MVLARRWFALCVSLLVLVSLPHQLSAHSPYFGQSEEIDLPGFGAIQFAVLYGDGVIFADPARVVVFDSDGTLLAVTPLSVTLFIQCQRSDKEPFCQVYDELSGHVFEPAYESWVRSGAIAQDGRPVQDPELMKAEYGFTQRSATFAETTSFTVAGILNARLVTFLSALWWFVAWSSVARHFWRWKRNAWRLVPLRWWTVTTSVLAFLGFMAMGMLAAFDWFFCALFRLFFRICLFDRRGSRLYRDAAKITAG